MVETMSLAPAAELAARNGVHIPNESREYRTARNALLVEEIELRRHIERVAEQRRALPPGGQVTKDFRFIGQSSELSLSELFGDRQTLLVYSAMYGPQRAQPCPVCTSLLSAWDGTARNVTELIALAVVARSPVERLLAYKNERGWQNLQVYSDMSGDYTRAYVSPEDADAPAVNIFTRRDGIIRHFWTAEMGPATVDPGQDPRGAPDIDPLWTMLDLTPEGRGTTWYPKLEYGPQTLTQIR